MTNAPTQDTSISDSNVPMATERKFIVNVELGMLQRAARRSRREVRETAKVPKEAKGKEETKEEEREKESLVGPAGRRAIFREIALMRGRQGKLTASRRQV